MQTRTSRILVRRTLCTHSPFVEIAKSRVSVGGGSTDGKKEPIVDTDKTDLVGVSPF